MSTKRGVSARAIASAFALPVLLAAAACVQGSGGPELVVENRLAVPAALYDRGDFVEDMGAGEVFDYSILKFGGVTRYELRGSTGVVLAVRCYTWDELKGQKWHIVFDSPKSTQASSGACL